VRTAQSIGGRLTLWAAALLLLAWHEVSLVMMIALSLVMIVPQQRHLLLSVAAAGTVAEMALESAGWHWQNHAVQLGVLLLAGIGGLYVAFLMAKHFQQWPAFARRFPILTLHAAIWLAILLSTLPMLGVLIMVPFLTWRLSYMLALGRRGKMADSRFRDHLFYLVPVYGGSLTPYGKGLDFLSRNEAVNPECFARSQLAGIKLLLLALLWIFVLEFMDASLFGNSTNHFAGWPRDWTVGLPRLAERLQSGVFPAWYQGWALVYLELILTTLRVAITGHVIVGCLRLLGFNVFRNTYKPLLSESIVEFWNRYYYYFKELLVEFFFYPTYLKYFKTRPRLRMFMATMAAAGLGNMLYHFFRDIHIIMELGIWGALKAFQVYVFYGVLLGTAIGLSQLRNQNRKQSTHWFRTYITAPVTVLGFYCISHIFGLPYPGYGLDVYFQFLMNMINVGVE